jgi:hypothetical protein
LQLEPQRKRSRKKRQLFEIMNDLREVVTIAAWLKLIPGIQQLHARDTGVLKIWLGRDKVWSIEPVLYSTD